jgi:acetyl-CoA acetyltransferase
MTEWLSRRTAIAGIGRVQYKRGGAPGSQRRTLLEAIVAAAEDAGIDPADIDGFCSFGDDENEPVKMMHDLGTKELRWSSAVWGGGGGGICAAIGQAAAAIATGQARTVVVFRALVQGDSGRLSAAVSAHHINWHYLLGGLTTPVAICAMRAQRMLEANGVASSAVEALVRADYFHASRNPEAVAFGNSFSSEDYHNSRWIVEPYRLFDCSRENDGAGAIIVTSAEHARDLKQKPVYVLGVAQGAQRMGNDLLENDNDYGSCQFETIAPRAFRMAGLTPKDIDVAQIYENFSGQAVGSIIGHGFCSYEGAGEFITFENIIAPSGKLPINTHGGNIAQGFIHGMGVLIEAAQQMRGESANPVPGAKHCLVASGAPAPVVSTMILGNEA